MRIRGRARDGWKTKGKCWKPHFRYFQSPFLQCLLVKHLSTHLDLGVSLRLGPLDVSPTSKSVPGSGRVFSAWPPKTSKHGWMSVCAKIFKYYCFFILTWTLWNPKPVWILDQYPKLSSSVHLFEMPCVESALGPFSAFHRTEAPPVAFQWCARPSRNGQRCPPKRRGQCGGSIRAQSVSLKRHENALTIFNTNWNS